VTRDAERAGVVELVIGQQWPIVAFGAARLVDEQLQAKNFCVAENPFRAGIATVLQRANVSIES